MVAFRRRNVLPVLPASGATIANWKTTNDTADNFIVAGPFARARAFNHNPVWREYSYLGGMDAIAIGCITAMLLSGKRLSKAAIYACGASGAALLIFSLCFSIEAYTWGLGRNGLNMTVLAVGTCLAIAAAAQSRWQAPHLLRPLLVLGRNSYEIYLTHMFIVLGMFAVFMHYGAHVHDVIFLFVGVIVGAGLLGMLVAGVFAEPMNRWIRRKAGDDAAALGAAMPQAD